MNCERDVVISSEFLNISSYTRLILWRHGCWENGCFFYSQLKTNQNMYSRDMSKQTNTIAKANLCINHENKLRISRFNTGREVAVYASIIRPHLEYMLLTLISLVI